MRYRILLVDDHGIVREGMRLVLCREQDLQVVGEASSVRGAIEAVDKFKPDLVVMDIQMSDGSGIDASRRIHEVHPEVRILIVSALSDVGAVRQALEAGASGFMRKEQAAAELARAIRTILSGQTFLCPMSATALSADITRKEAPVHAPPGLEQLSERELQVLKLVAEGHRNKEIAEALKVGVKSVETYRARLMRKLECESPAELVRCAVKLGVARL